MMKMNSILAEMKESILKWAHERDDIRLVIVVGSRTRSERPGSELSDLDLLIFSDNQEFYLANQDWITRFGTVFLAEQSISPSQDPELMVVYDNFQGVDFVLIPAGVIKQLSPEQELPDIFLRGFEVWVDKDDVNALLTSIADAQKHNLLRPRRPSQIALEECVQLFETMAYEVAEAGNYSLDTTGFEKTKLFLDSIRNAPHNDD